MVSRFKKGILLAVISIFFAGSVFVYNGAKADKNLSGDLTDVLVIEEELYVPGEVIVKFKEEDSKASNVASDKVATKKGQLTIKERIPNSNLAVLEIGEGDDVRQVAQELSADTLSNIEYAEPNHLYRVSSGPISSVNDTYKNFMWGLHNYGQTVNGFTGTSGADIDIVQAWDKSKGQNVIVAVIDSGVQYTHPDLQNNMWDGNNCKNENGGSLGGCIHGYDFYDNDKDPAPISSLHGTHVAGTIAAQKNNSRGVIGVAPQTKIMAIRVGDDLFPASSIISGIKFAEANGAKIINASFGGAGFNQTMKDTINNFSGLFVTASGNSGKNHNTSNNYPCDYQLSNIICVAATNQHDQLASFSDYGSSYVHVGAPGTNILSTVADISVDTVFFEAFDLVESGTVGNKFTSSGTQNNWGVRNNSGNKGISPTHSTHTPYASNANSLLTLENDLDVSGVDRVSLEFKIQCDTEVGNWNDRVQVHFLNNSGSWVTSNSWRYNSNNVSDDSLDQITINLDSEDYIYDGFKFRFNWVTNSFSNNYLGCDIDDIELLTYTLGSGEQYSYSSGTSMATPHVSGLAALIMSYRPSLSLSGVKQAIVGTGDSLNSLNGKTISGKRINAIKALSSLDVVSPTPTPTPKPTPTPTPTPAPTPKPDPLKEGIVPHINSIFRRAFGVNPTVAEWRYWADRSIKDKPDMAALFGAMQYHSINYGRSPNVIAAKPVSVSPDMITNINRFVRLVWGRNPTFNQWQYWADRITSGNVVTLPQLLGAMQWQRLMGR